MSFPRLLAVASLLSVLAACNNSSNAPATPQEGAAPATTTDAAPASPPATTTPAAPAPSAPAASDDKIAPMIGFWSADLAACGSTPIRITPTSFEGAENRCTITAFADNGDGSFTAALNCAGEGATTSERIKMRPLFAPTGEGIGMTYLDRDNAEVTVLRCAETKGATQ